MKRCPDCGEWKPLDEFPRNRRTRDGRHAYCKPCHNARCRETRERLYGGSRHYHLRRRYGFGAAEVDELIEGQGGVCPICGRPDPEHVDHDHVTGVVRGVLCFNCNGGLGQFGDDPVRLVEAAAYIARTTSPELDQQARARAAALRAA
ncbi:MAG TPA: endonuclease domain-containing protein [Acidimicrobiia bacterium]|jgi:hypothetical protein